MVQALLKERFGKDSLLALATEENGKPSVRTVNGYYEDGKFYVITYVLSQKMKQIQKNPQVALCGDWFSAHGIGENIGHPREPRNTAIASTLKEVFSAWYQNGHVDEEDQNTCILCIHLTDGVLFHHGTRYDLVFPVSPSSTDSLGIY